MAFWDRLNPFKRMGMKESNPSPKSGGETPDYIPGQEADRQPGPNTSESAMPTPEPGKEVMAPKPTINAGENAQPQQPGGEQIKG